MLRACRVTTVVGHGWARPKGSSGSGCLCTLDASPPTAAAPPTLLRPHTPPLATRQACGVRFRAYRLLPCGSLPRVADVRAGTTHDLHGPVSKFLCHSYDRAQASAPGPRGREPGGGCHACGVRL